MAVADAPSAAIAIGREFSYRLLEAAAPIQGPALQDALGQLMSAELIYGRGAPPEATYIFKHALVSSRPSSTKRVSAVQREVA